MVLPVIDYRNLFSDLSQILKEELVEPAQLTYEYWYVLKALSSYNAFILLDITRQEENTEERNMEAAVHSLKVILSLHCFTQLCGHIWYQWN